MKTLEVLSGREVRLNSNSVVFSVYINFFLMLVVLLGALSCGSSEQQGEGQSPNRGTTGGSGSATVEGKDENTGQQVKCEVPELSAEALNNIDGDDDGEASELAADATNASKDIVCVYMRTGGVREHNIGGRYLVIDTAHKGQKSNRLFLKLYATREAFMTGVPARATLVVDSWGLEIKTCKNVSNEKSKVTTCVPFAQATVEEAHYEGNSLKIRSVEIRHQGSSPTANDVWTNLPVEFPGESNRPVNTQWTHLNCSGARCSGFFDDVRFEFNRQAYCPSWKQGCALANTFLYCENTEDCLNGEVCEPATQKCREASVACLAQSDCLSGSYCSQHEGETEGTCRPWKQSGDFCLTDVECRYGCNIYSATCNYCQADTACVEGWCDSSAGTCNSQFSDGFSCERNAQCQVGSSCQAGVCAAVACEGGLTPCAAGCKDPFE